MTPYPLYRRLCSGVRFKNPIKRKKQQHFLQYLLPIDGGKTDQRSRGPLINTSHCISAAPTDMSVSGIVHSVIRSPSNNVSKM